MAKTDEKDSMARFTQTRDENECEEAVCKKHRVEIDQKPSPEARLPNLEEALKKQQQSLDSLELHVEVMDLGISDLFLRRDYGLKRPLVVYGILEFIHKEYLTFAALKSIKTTTLKASANLENRCLKFFNTQVFNGDWQHGTYEELLEAWRQREKKGFSYDEIDWIESALSEGERNVQFNEKASDVLRGMSSMDFRSAVATALSINGAAKRNMALYFLGMGDKATRLIAVDDLLQTLSNGKLKAYAEVTQIIMCGCNLYKATL